MHLADTFIQSNLQYIQAIHFISKRALLRIGFIISLHFKITGVIVHVLPYVLSLSL